MEIKKNEEVYGFDVSSPSKAVFNFKLSEGFYLVFIDKLDKRIKIEDEFFEILYNKSIYLIRAKDALNRSIGYWNSS